MSEKTSPAEQKVFAGGSSSTARLIARSLIYLAQDTRRSLVSPDAAKMCRWFLEEGAGATPAARQQKGARWKRLSGASWFRRLVALTEQATLPGILDHYALRKLYIEDVVRRSLDEDGFTQIVVLGAGFDTLALRLHRAFPAVRFFEVDHPGTQQVKTDAVARHTNVGPNLRFVAADLAHDDLLERLSASSRGEPAYSPARDTLWVAEGLLMYLPEAAVDFLFRSALRPAQGERGNAPRSRIAFTFMEPTGPGGETNFSQSSRVINYWLRLRGEKFQWGIEQSRLPACMEARKWRVRAVATPLSLRERFLPTERSAPGRAGKTVPQGDIICVADALS